MAKMDTEVLFKDDDDSEAKLDTEVIFKEDSEAQISVSKVVKKPLITHKSVVDAIEGVTPVDPMTHSPIHHHGPHGHILDVDQPRYDDDDDFAIDWVKLGCAVRKRVRRVKEMLVYNDDRADLAEIIETYGPCKIDLLHDDKEGMCFCLCLISLHILLIVCCVNCNCVAQNINQSSLWTIELSDCLHYIISIICHGYNQMDGDS